MKTSLLVLAAILLSPTMLVGQSHDKPRVRNLGLEIGIFQPGAFNDITDVRGVLVGHVTLSESTSIRTGVTAILPHAGNLFREKVPAGVYVGNGFGKLVGVTQIEELGQIETPILLTNTLSVWNVANGIVDYMLGLAGNENVRSINPIVGETNDGGLNDIRSRSITREHAVQAIKAATTGPIAEGCVGAGTGTVCFGWKGGIGSSSRRLPSALGGASIGVLVQTNFGGIFELAGVPVGKELGQYSFRNEIQKGGDGSCMIVVATDAPLDARQLKRLAKRATLALGRTGSSMSHGSGDYVIAFSTAESARLRIDDEQLRNVPRLREDDLSPLFQAVVEATEEAIINSLLQAVDTKGQGNREIKALPIERVRELLRKYGKVH